MEAVLVAFPCQPRPVVALGPQVVPNPPGLVRHDPLAADGAPLRRRERTIGPPTRPGVVTSQYGLLIDGRDGRGRHAR
jgi:hypothetical protein